MILLGLGSNLSGPWGTPLETLRCALREMQTNGIAVVKRSKAYSTCAYGVGGQPDYVNAVVSIDCIAPPEALLIRLHRLEKFAARARGERWGARTLDIDLLDWHGRVIGSSKERGGRTELGFKPLSLPHPGIVNRPFVIVPLAEIAPGWHHPVNGKTAKSLARNIACDRAGGILSATRL
ncbi:MAG: 2-amino-4-hydroxy-6-hydroxymethyldihydropteridine diphosphokinase [Alphaproteobacteria bacterium]|nr:2-amino-4-hydroxy-6-hydroxymethyldihydropteridine diphosphokinase [Alphaproteobacteria bacterium]